VFPTGVGMNRSLACSTTILDSVPHRRGDEPVMLPTYIPHPFLFSKLIFSDSFI